MSKQNKRLEIQNASQVALLVAPDPTFGAAMAIALAELALGEQPEAIICLGDVKGKMAAAEKAGKKVIDLTLPNREEGSLLQRVASALELDLNHFETASDIRDRLRDNNGFGQKGKRGDLRKPKYSLFGLSRAIWQFAPTFFAEATEPRLAALHWFVQAAKVMLERERKHEEGDLKKARQKLAELHSDVFPTSVINESPAFTLPGLAAQVAAQYGDMNIVAVLYQAHLALEASTPTDEECWAQSRHFELNVDHPDNGMDLGFDVYFHTFNKSRVKSEGVSDEDWKTFVRAVYDRRNRKHGRVVYATHHRTPRRCWKLPDEAHQAEIQIVLVLQGDELVKVILNRSGDMLRSGGSIDAPCLTSLVTRKDGSWDTSQLERVVVHCDGNLDKIQALLATYTPDQGCWHRVKLNLDTRKPKKKANGNGGKRSGNGRNKGTRRSRGGNRNGGNSGSRRR